MFYRFTDDANILRYIRFCEISEVDVLPGNMTVEIYMGNGKVHKKSLPTPEEAYAMADGLIRMTASYKRNTTQRAPFVKNNGPKKPYDQQRKPYQ
jgi:hypothetical protein